MSAIDMIPESQPGRHQYPAQASAPDRQQPSGAADASRGRSKVAFGARAAILAGALAAGCAVVTPAAAHVTVAHSEAHTMTAIALGAAGAGVVNPMDSSCCT